MINHVRILSKIFISYSRSDAEFAKRIINDLRIQNIDVWVDTTSLQPGTPSWEVAIRDAIRDAGAVILIASPSALKSKYVQGELDIAEMYSRPILPVWVDGETYLECVPLAMSKTQYIDMRADRYFDQLVTLIRWLTHVTSSPGFKVSVTTAESTISEIEPRNPYKGLKAFSSEDVQDFFGRANLITGLREAIVSKNDPLSRFLAIVGASGSGKSSIVMAGLLPSLRSNPAMESNHWYYLEPMVPTPHPLENLALTLGHKLPSLTLTGIQEDLNRSSRGLVLLGKRIATKSNMRVVLFVDQFEELFSTVIDEQVRRQFIDLLVTSIQETQSPMVVIITLRGDFYDRPMNYPGLGKLIEARNKSVLPMSVEELRDVIQNPVLQKDVNLLFEQNLIGDLLFDVSHEIGGLPLLQFTLDQLFQRRVGHYLTHAAYLEMGRLRGAIGRHAEMTYGELPSDEHRRLARALFLRLIDLGPTEQDTTRRRVILSELELPDPKQTKILGDVANIFVNARLLTTNMKTIEVSHEAIIQAWSTLAEWLREFRDDIHFQQKISRDASEWIRYGRSSDQLYRGAELMEAVSWRNRYLTANIEEIAFVEASNLAETENQHNIDILIEFRNLSLELLRATTTQQVMDLIVEYALLIAGARDVCIYTYDRDADALNFGASLWTDGRENIEPAPLKRGGVSWLVARTGLSHAFPDLGATPDAEIFHDPIPTGAFACIPIKRAGVVLGVLNISYYSAHHFSDDELGILDLLTNQAAIAIEDTRLFNEVIKSRDHMQVILDAALDGMILIGQKGELVLANLAAEALTGYPLRNHLGKSLLRQIIAVRKSDPEIHEALTVQIHEVITTIKSEPEKATRRIFQAYGREVEETTLPVMDSTGHPYGRLIVLRDMSKK